MMGRRGVAEGAGEASARSECVWARGVMNREPAQQHGTASDRRRLADGRAAALRGAGGVCAEAGVCVRVVCDG